MDEDLIADLLYRSEGTALDFKQAQYRFVKATEADKSELLKDVLAMANAWRDGPAYIVLGFREQKPDLPLLTGITESLDDADLQKFIGSKVRPTLTFTYEEGLYQGAHIGLLSIPKQPRPFYVVNTYGKVHSNVIYVRRGSSTVEAEPPESLRMASADHSPSLTANVDLLLVDGRREEAPEAVSLTPYRRTEDFPDFVPYGDKSSLLGLPSTFLERTNPSYWRQMAEYMESETGCMRLHLRLRNRSTFALSDCMLEINVESTPDGNVRLKAGRQMPREPEMMWAPSLLNALTTETEKRAFDIVGGPNPLAVFRLAKLLPGETFTAKDYLAVFPSITGRLKFSARLLATELPEPLQLEKSISVTLQPKDFGLEVMELRERDKLVSD